MTDRTRREFLQRSMGLAGAGLAASVAPRDARAEEAKAEDRPVPMRDLGKTGMKVAMLSQGGYHLGTLSEKEAVAQVHRAMDLGLNFFDNAWNYHKGRSEEFLGTALKDGGRRAKVFVMTKGEYRTKQGAARQIEDSLKRMQTDYIDLWQFHGVAEAREVEEIWGPGGAMEAAQAALKAGKIRHLGLTGHADPATHLLALERGGFETIQMPLNPLDAHFMSFQKQVIPKAREKGVGVIAMKTLSFGKALEHKLYTPDESLRYVWTLGVDVLVSGMTSIALLEHNVGLARAFTPMPDGDREALLARIKPSAGTQVEFYKVKA